jgi:hypothetical protein
MKSPLYSLLFISAVAFCSSAPLAQAAPPATQQALTPQQINEGFRAGLNLIVTQALTSDAVKISPPSLLTKAEPTLAKNGQAGLLKDFTDAFSVTVSKIAPKAAELIKEELKDVKIEDATALLSGKPNEASEFLRKKIAESVRLSLLPLVKQTTAGTNLAVKAKTVLNAIDERGVKGGSMLVVSLDDNICKQIIAESFKLIARKEAAVRANPALLEGNALAQKTFAQFKK